MPPHSHPETSSIIIGPLPHRHPPSQTHFCPISSPQLQLSLSSTPINIHILISPTSTPTLLPPTPCPSKPPLHKLTPQIFPAVTIFAPIIKYQSLSAPSNFDFRPQTQGGDAKLKAGCLWRAADASGWDEGGKGGFIWEYYLINYYLFCDMGKVIRCTSVF